MRELKKAMENGYTLTVSQQVFWDDTASLYATYNQGRNILEVL